MAENSKKNNQKKTQISGLFQASEFGREQRDLIENQNKEDKQNFKEQVLANNRESEKRFSEQMWDQIEPSRIGNSIDDCSYGRDKNWYYDTDNIRNSTLVFDTFEFLEEIGYNAIDFLNLFHPQYDDIIRFGSKPFDYLENLKKIPIDEKQYFHLIGLLLKWYGGFPPSNENKQIETILKLLYKELIKMNVFDLEEKEKYLSFYSNESKNTETALAVFRLSTALGGNSFESPHLKTSTIETTVENKDTKYIKGSKLEKSKWKKSTALLAYLFYKLECEGLITEGTIGANISQVFVDKQYKDINNVTINKAIKDYKDGVKAQSKEQIDEIIALVKAIDEKL